MAKIAKPKKFKIAPAITVLFDRAKISETMEGGWFRTIDAPTIYRFTTEMEGDFFIDGNGKKVPGKDADILAEFDSAEWSERGPKAKP